MTANAKLLISNSIFTSCSGSSQGGNIYANTGSIALYRICGVNFSFSGNSGVDGAFSFAQSSNGMSYLNSMNDSCIANGGGIDNGNSLDYRVYGKQFYNSNNCSHCKSYFDMYDFEEDSGYVLTISHSNLANTTTHGGAGIYFTGDFKITMSSILGNKCTSNPRLFCVYKSIIFELCIILDNQNPGTFVKSTVTMTKCRYNGDMNYVTINGQQNDLVVYLSLLSTANFQAINPIAKMIKKKNECTNIVINQNYTNYHILLVICFLIE